MILGLREKSKAVIEAKPADIMDVNDGAVAESLRLHGVRRLVHISTFGVYDSRREMREPIQESFPRGPGRGYGNSKVAK